LIGNLSRWHTWHHCDIVTAITLFRIQRRVPITRNYA
jgi:hypothetical protein